MTAFTYNPTCSVCHKRMGEMSGEEFESIVLAECLDAKCFNCDMGESLLVPSVFQGWEIGDMFVIDDEVLLVEGYFSSGRLSDRLAHTHERARTHPVYLVSTYLNTFPNEAGKEERIIPLDIRRLPQVGGYACSDCLRYRRERNLLYCDIHQAILEAEQWQDSIDVGKSYMDGRPGCPDCDTIVSLGFVGYCTYHQDLAETYFDRLAKAAGHVQ